MVIINNVHSSPFITMDNLFQGWYIFLSMHGGTKYILPQKDARGADHSLFFRSKIPLNNKIISIYLIHKKDDEQFRWNTSSWRRDHLFGGMTYPYLSKHPSIAILGRH